MVASPKAALEDLKRVAARKLAYVIAKKTRTVRGPRKKK